MRRALAIVVIVSSASCKTDDAKPPPAPPTATAPAPAKVAEATHELLDTVLLREPRLPGATPLAPLKIVEERERAQQSWCMPGSDAVAVASTIREALTAAGWSAAAARGTAERAAISGTADDVSVSITVGGRDASCTGLVASATYTTTTVIIPPLEDGERIR